MDVYLVRHGEAAASWGVASDPGLSDLGKQQASAAADLLVPKLSPDVHLVSSPLLRAQETAVPFSSALELEVSLNDAFREVPAPVPFEQRQAWIKGFMAQKWAQQPDLLTRWRDGVLQELASLESPTVIFSHFLVINAVVGSLSGEERTVCFRPAYASVTHLTVDKGELRLLNRGVEMTTFIN